MHKAKLIIHVNKLTFYGTKYQNKVNLQRCKKCGQVYEENEWRNMVIRELCSLASALCGL